jgi:hypothetical protein
MGNQAKKVHVLRVNSNAQSDDLPSQLAEEILRVLYGDDFRGCTVHPDQIAAVINAGLKPRQIHAHQLLELYEKVVEAIDLLSTPPDPAKVTNPEQLRALLSERLDTIHTVTTRTIQTASRAKENAPPTDPSQS